MADEAAPAEAVETNGNGGNPDHGLYDLSTVPEELRGYVEPHLQTINKNADKKIRELSESLKPFEPLKGIDGLTDVDPEELQALLQFREIASNEDSLKEWIGAVSQELGLAPEMDEDAWASLGEENGWLDPEDGDDDGAGVQNMDLEAIVAAVKEAIAPDIEGVKQTQQMRDEQDAVKAIEQEMRGQMDVIKQQNADVFADNADAVEEDILALAGRYIEDENPIAKGFEHYQRIRGNGASDAIDKKLDVPSNGQTLTGGNTNTAAEPMTFQSAKEAAKQRFAQQR